MGQLIGLESSVRRAEIEVIHLLKAALNIWLRRRFFRRRGKTRTSERQHRAGQQRFFADLLQ